MENNTKDNVENDSASTFNIYNRRSVDALIKKNPDILKYVNKDEDYSYNKDKINNVITQSIMSGISLDKITERITQVTGMDENGAKRTARTAMTAAENLGRNEGYHDLKEKGIPCRFQWSATHDSHTRDTHILLDGTYQNDDGYFGEGIIETLIEFPGDPAGDPEEIYNCRCRASLVLKGIDHSQDDELYEQFMKENFPDDWESVKEARDKNEEKFQEKASGAAERVEKERESKADNAEEQKAKEPEYSFTPAQTIEEAEQYAKDNFVVDSKWSGEGNVSFKGMSLENANAINEELTKLFAQNNVPPFRNIGMMNFREKIWKDAKDAPMAYRGMFNGDLFFNPNILKNEKTLETYMKKGREAFEFCINNTDKFSGKQLDLVLQYKEAGRQTIAEVCEDPLKAMLDHEFGHHVDHQVIMTNQDYVQTTKDGMDEFGIQISGYALHTRGEYVAESFCAYTNGFDIDPDLEEIFEKAVRK